MIVESFQHNVGEHQPSFDPCYREQTIGGYFYMCNSHLESVPLNRFHISMLDTLIFSEDIDDFYRMSFGKSVRALGLVSNWENGEQVGDMPLTELGEKYLKPHGTWGALYKRNGHLDLFIKHLRAKDDEVYADFVKKFLIETEKHELAPLPQAEMEGLALADQAETAPSLEWMNIDRFPEDSLGHRNRLMVLLRWLKVLDNRMHTNESMETTLFQQVVAYVRKHQEQIQGKDCSSYLALQLVWKKAQDLLLLLDLSVATRHVPSTSLTSLERYIRQDTPQHNWSDLTPDNLSALHRLNEESPYWKPTGPQASMVEVLLVAPEEGAGETSSGFKRLSHPTLAYTLSSHFIALFAMDMREVKRMLAADDNQPTLFDIAMHLPSNSPPSSERAAKLQFNILLSAMYATLIHMHKASAGFKTKADESKYIEQVAKQWLALAHPENMLTRSSNGFMDVAEKRSSDPILNYQAPMDGLIHSLREALISLLSMNEEQQQQQTRVNRFVLR
jgi:hypothetical protein